MIPYNNNINNNFRYLGQSKIEPSENFVVTQDGDKHTLVIKKVAKSMEGLVNVKVINDAGQMSAPIRLRVAGLYWWIKLMHKINIL